MFIPQLEIEFGEQLVRRVKEKQGNSAIWNIAVLFNQQYLLEFLFSFRIILSYFFKYQTSIYEICDRIFIITKVL